MSQPPQVNCKKVHQKHVGHLKSSGGSIEWVERSTNGILDDTRFLCYFCGSDVDAMIQVVDGINEFASTVKEIFFLQLVFIVGILLFFTLLKLIDKN